MASKTFVLAFGITIAVAAITLDAQQPSRRFYPDDPMWVDDDKRDIAPVAEDELSKSYDFLLNTFKRSKVTAPAVNVNTLGEVPDSSWFTNRIGVRDMSLAEILRGPDTIDGPAPGAWEIIGHPAAGVTPKFAIRDANGNVFLIKLDPSNIPELASSVELIGTKIFHAIGYTVPEDFIASLDPKQLRVSPKATIKSEDGTGERAMTITDVQRWLKHQVHQPDGTIRVLASRWVPGKVVGSFRFTGTRPDDPNDIYAHDLRRELRGLRVFAAWLNHDDARSLNSIDTYVEENGRRYVRHYLQDFGSTLGSGSTSPQQPRGGYEYLIETDKVAKGILGFGLWQRDWMKAKYSNEPSIGNIESVIFKPAEWKTEYPHPAFDAMDAEDGFWAARIAARFSDETIRAIVGSAKLSNAAAAATLARVMIERRDKVVAQWITGVNPLDSFEVREVNSGMILLWDNAAIRTGVARGGESYQTTWTSFDNRTGIEQPALSGDVEEYSEPVARIPSPAFGPADASGARYAIATIRTFNADYPRWTQPVRVTVRERSGRFDIVGIDRRGGMAAASTNDN